MDTEGRVVGSMLGLALGDALGAPFEFRRSRDIPDPPPALELPWRSLPPGSTTEATAMARNLARSLAERDGFDPDDVVARHLAWFRTGPPDVGSLTRNVMRRVAAGVPAPEAARAAWEERGPEASADNGSVMYCAPLALAHANRPNLLPDLGPRLSGLTHHDERCRTAVVTVTLALASLVRGDPADRAVGDALAAVQDRQGGEELEFLTEAVGSVRKVDGPDRRFCLFAAGLGLQAAARGGTFESELLRVVSLGGDTDTNAAMAGALTGAIAGLDGLPPGWLARLRDRGPIEREAGALVPLALRTE